MVNVFWLYIGAPQGPAGIAWGNAPGMTGIRLEALKGRPNARREKVRRSSEPVRPFRTAAGVGYRSRGGVTRARVTGSILTVRTDTLDYERVPRWRGPGH